MKLAAACSVLAFIHVVNVVAGCTKTTDHAEAAPAVKPAQPPVSKPAPPRAPAPTPVSPAKDPKMANEITWKMTKHGDRLHVAYHFENHTSHVVYVNNGLVAQISSDKWVKTELNSDLEVVDASTVMIIVGSPSGDVPVAAAPPGFYVPVAKGASFDGSREIPLPFTRTDAMGREKPLGGTFTKASFQLYAFDGEPEAWRELPTDHGKVRVPDAPPLRMLTGAVQPLP